MVNPLIKLSIALGLACSSISAFAGFKIVSDIDDTVKLTHVRSNVDAAKNGIFGNKTFLGMAELYQELSSSSKESQAMVFVSGSPQSLKGSLSDMLVGEKGFPDAEFYLKNWIKDGSTKDFKVSAFKKIAAQSPLPMILLGDDTEHDPQAFVEFIASQPKERVLAAYVHQVHGETLPAGVTPYVTAMDVALLEMSVGRLTAEQVERIGNRMLAQWDPELLFPDYKRCPERISDETNSDPKLAKVAAIKASLDRLNLKYCTIRNAGEVLEPKKFYAPSGVSKAIKKAQGANQKKLLDSVESEL